MAVSSEELKKIRDEGIIDAELAMGASEMVLECIHELQELYRRHFNKARSDNE